MHPFILPFPLHTDIDECAEHGKCSQICTNTKGSYKCSCNAGYQLDLVGRDDDGVLHHGTCRAVSPPGTEEPALIFGNRRDIRKLALHSGHYETLVADTRSAIALDFDHDNGYLYWTDVTEEKIKRIRFGNTNNSQAEVLVDKDGVLTPDGVALDWVNQNLYWTDTGLDSISMISLGGGDDKPRYRKTLVNTNLDEPRAIVVDPREGQRYVYYTDWGQNPRIVRMGLNGEDPTVLVDREQVVWPNGLTIGEFLLI